MKKKKEPLNLEQAIEKFKQNYPGMDEPGTRWEIRESCAVDERHYGHRGFVEPDAVIEASGAVEALHKYVLNHSLDLYMEQLQDFEDCWMKGDVSPDRGADWFFDDGCFDGDQFNWVQISIKKVA